MKGKNTQIALLVLIVIGMIGYFLYTTKKEFVLGLDLAGGTALTYTIETGVLPKDVNVEDAVAALRDVVERRVNLFGVREPTVITQYSRLSNEWRLSIELPGVTNMAEAAKMIGETPVLDFRVPKSLSEKATGTVANASTSALTLADFKQTELSGRYLKRAQLIFDQATQKPLVELNFDETGTKLFAQITKAYIGKQVAIFLDGSPISVPTVQQEITGGKATISGSFTIDEARVLVGRLNSGALPVPIKLQGTSLVGPALGEKAVNAGRMSSLYGFLVVIAFMIFFYRLPGLVASIALVAYGVMMLTLFKFIPITLTASGIAGFIISIGLAVDANVLVFERMKEELRSGKSMKDAVEEGFKRAWTSIRDSHVAAIIVAIILFWLGTSLVKGFAFTFFLGTVLSLISAQLITRLLLRGCVPQKTGKVIRFLFGSGFSK